MQTYDAFWAALAAGLPGSEVTITNVGLNPTRRGDNLRRDLGRHAPGFRRRGAQRRSGCYANRLNGGR